LITVPARGIGAGHRKNAGRITAPQVILASRKIDDLNAWKQDIVKAAWTRHQLGPAIQRRDGQIDHFFMKYQT